MSRRVQRVGEQLKREISAVLRSQVHDPRVSGVTVTGVEVSPDLTFARVWVQLSGDDEKQRTALEGLTAAAPFVRRQLGDLVRMRRIPELDFQQDLTLERALRIEALLREVTPVEGGEGGQTPTEGGAAESGGKTEEDEDKDSSEE